MPTGSSRALLSRLKSRLSFTKDDFVDGQTDSELYAERLKAAQARDDEHNRSCMLPDGESVEFDCIWAVEFYTPSHLDKLIETFQASGWTDTGQSLSPRDPVEWLQSLRRGRHGDGMIWLGMLVPPGGESQLFGACREMHLPDYFEYAHIQLYSLSTSVTAMSVCFVTNEKNAEAMNDILLQQYETQMIPTGPNQYSIRYPELRKLDDAKAVRIRLTEAATNWMAQEFPGLFASGILDGNSPTCELVTTQQTLPFPEGTERQPSQRQYLWILELDRAFDAWRDAQSCNLAFRGTSSLRHHAILAARADYFEDGDSEAEPANRHLRAYRLNTDIADPVLGWAILQLLEGYTSQVGKMRNAQSDRSSKRRSEIKALEDLERSVFDGGDVGAIAGEIADNARNGFWFLGRAYRFRYSQSHNQAQEDRAAVEYVAWLREQIGDQAKWLVAIELSHRQHASQVGTLIAAHENVRLQKSIGWFTKAVAAMTFVIIVDILYVPVRWMFENWF